LAGIGVLLITRRQFRGGVILVTTACAVLAATVAVLIVVGNFGEVVDQSVLFNFYYVGRPANVNNFFIQLLAQTWSVFSGSQSGLWIAGGHCIAEVWRRGWLLWRLALVVGVVIGLYASSRLQYREYGNAWYSRVVSNTHSTEEFVAGAIGTASGSLFI
jgi:hypothetical protein